MVKKKGQPTGTNLFVLASLFSKHDVIPARVEARDFNHLKRCLEAGFCEAHGDNQLKLTEAGEKAIEDSVIARNVFNQGRGR